MKPLDEGTGLDTMNAIALVSSCGRKQNLKNRHELPASTVGSLCHGNRAFGRHGRFACRDL